MTRILTIIALLFATPAWASEVDGNSFYCKKKSENSYDKAIRFKDGKVEVYTTYLYSTHYWDKSTQVAWGRLSSVFRINRKSLELAENVVLKDIRFWQCEFMEFSKAQKLVDEYNEKMASQRQKKYLEEIEGNQF